jgi:cell division protein FtsL
VLSEKIILVRIAVGVIFTTHYARRSPPSEDQREKKKKEWRICNNATPEPERMTFVVAHSAYI